MNLSTFIREHQDTILREWEETAKAIFDAEAAQVNRDVLLDHAKDMLGFIADSIDRLREKGESSAQHYGPATGAEKHGINRMKWGFDLDQVIAEYRALRTSVTKLWTREQNGLRGDDVEDLTRFNEAMDQALSEGIASYSVEKNKQNRLFEGMLSASPDQSYIVDPDGRFMYANEAAAKMFGQSVAQLIRMKLSDLHIPAADELLDRVRHVAATARPLRCEIEISLPPGETRNYEYVCAPIVNRNGQVEAVAAASRDVTERREVEREAWISANFDPLTRIPNRRLFVDRLQQGMKSTRRRKSGLALLFIDLDRFKSANDILGHDGGDMLLQRVAERIVDTVREADTVARLGGDEFLVILKDVVERREAARVTEKIVSAIERPLSIKGTDVRSSASIGIAFYPRDARTVQDLMAKADHAMYAAKDAGGNGFRFFAED